MTVQYFPNQDEAKENATINAQEINGHLETSSYQCACGQSHAYRVVSTRQNTVAIYVDCEACYNEYE